MGNISTHFSRQEFACKGINCDGNGNNCGFAAVDIELIRLLEEVREHFGKPVHINSGCRCEAHNKAVGGSENSQHKFARAADIVIEGVHPDKIYAFFDNRYPTQFGLGGYPNFVHIDSRSVKARW